MESRKHLGLLRARINDIRIRPRRKNARPRRPYSESKHRCDRPLKQMWRTFSKAFSIRSEGIPSLSNPLNGPGFRFPSRIFRNEIRILA